MMLDESGVEGGIGEAEAAQLSGLEKIAAEAGRNESDIEGEFQESGSGAAVDPQSLPVYECMCMALTAMSKVLDMRMTAAGLPGQGLEKEEIEAIAIPAAACIDKYCPAGGGVGPEGALVLSVAMVAFPRFMAVSNERVKRLKRGDKSEPKHPE